MIPTPPPVAPVPVQSPASPNAFTGLFNVQSAHGRLFVRLRHPHHHHPHHTHRRHHKNYSVTAGESIDPLSRQVVVLAVNQGELFHQGVLFMRGLQSGRGAGFNNIAYSNIKKFGGPQPGVYRLSNNIDAQATNDKGDRLTNKNGNLIDLGYNRFKLIPTFATNRSDIEFHKAYGRGSIGCETTPSQEKENELAALKSKFGIKYVIVVGNYDPTQNFQLPNMMIASAETPAPSSPYKQSLKAAVADAGMGSNSVAQPAAFTTISLPENSIMSTLRDYKSSYTLGSRTFKYSLDLSARP